MTQQEMRGRFKKRGKKEGNCKMKGTNFEIVRGTVRAEDLFFFLNLFYPFRIGPTFWRNEKQTTK